MKLNAMICSGALILLTLLTGCGRGGEGESAAVAAEKDWVRAHLDDVYLWYDEIIEVPASSYSSPPAYFYALLVNYRDRFSYCSSETWANRLYQMGRTYDYGVTWGWAESGRLFAYDVDPASPAYPHITRGMELRAVNGTSLSSIGDWSLNDLLYPEAAGVPITLTLRLPGTQATRTVTMLSTDYPVTTVDKASVLTLSNGKKTGYLLFNSHLATAEQGLSAAINSFRQQGIDDLVLDLRYNSGGLLVIAEKAASMIGGTPVQGKVFQKLIFNTKHPEETADPDNTYHFSTTGIYGGQLPQLGVGRLFVLTGAGTCSASEAIINGLSPHMQVIRIGATTCGKPYGSRSTTNAGLTYFALRFEGVNSLGTADFKNGFAPTCEVPDDLNHQLGDRNEARLAAALYYMQNNACPPAATVALPKALPGTLPAYGEPEMLKNPAMMLQ